MAYASYAITSQTSVLIGNERPSMIFTLSKNEDLIVNQMTLSSHYQNYSTNSLRTAVFFFCTAYMTTHLVLTIPLQHNRPAVRMS